MMIHLVPPSRQRSNRLWAWSLVCGLVSAALALVVLVAGSHFDRVAREREEAVVSHGVTARVNEVAHMVVAQVVWDEAVRNLDNRFSRGWAHDNIGVFLSQNSGFSDLFVLNAAGVPVFAWRGAAEAPIADFGRLQASVAPLVEQVREQERHRGRLARRAGASEMLAEPIQANALARVGDGVVILTATLVQPDFGLSMPRSALSPIVIAVAQVDAAQLSALASRFMLDDLRLQPSGAAPSARVQLRNVAGEPVGVLTWTPQRPGSSFVNLLVAPLLALTAIFATLAVLLFVRDRRAAEANAARSAHVRLLEDAKRRADDENAGKAQFLATMTHELRTPLNAIIGFSELMREEADSGRRARDVEDHGKVIAAARHLLEMINDMLDFSLLDSARMRSNLKPYQPAKIVENIASTVRATAAQNGNQVVTDAPRSIGSAFGEDFRVTQCLMHLASNAAKFTKNGVITLSARRETIDGRDWLSFQVADTGIGVSKEMQERLFQPFSQADASFTRSAGGMGLGLAITRKVASLLGGSVSLESELGKGSCFTLRIPADVRALEREVA